MIQQVKAGWKPGPASQTWTQLLLYGAQAQAEKRLEDLTPSLQRLCSCLGSI
jgi:hypothetical protein